MSPRVAMFLSISFGQARVRRLRHGLFGDLTRLFLAHAPGDEHFINGNRGGRHENAFGGVCGNKAKL